VHALTNAETPFTVGIFGEWGVGKSTIIAAVKDRLSEEGDVAFAYFDAWRYEDVALRREFLRDVATQLEKAKQLSGFKVEKDLRDLDVEIASPEEAGFKFSWPEALRSLLTLVVGFVVIFALLRARVAPQFLHPARR
jgi:predicted AAA+ superfamily ATPase